jgi:hypothetical protein
VNAGIVRLTNGHSVLSSLSILNGAELRLTTNSMTVADGASSELIRQHLQSGRLTSSAADSTHGLGYFETAESGVQVKFAFLGDTNLDGAVDITDLGNLASAWQSSGYWINGDSDYNGIIDITDLGLLATNWQAGNLAEALSALGLPSASVPEPAMLVAGLSFLGARRRIRR